MEWSLLSADVVEMTKRYYKVIMINKPDYFSFEGFTSIPFPTALTANDRNRRIQAYRAIDG